MITCGSQNCTVMTKSLLVFPNSRIETKKVIELGCSILAMYPDQLLVRCNAQQERALSGAHIKTQEVPKESWY